MTHFLDAIRRAHPNLGSKRDAVSRLEGFGDNLVTVRTKKHQTGSKTVTKFSAKAGCKIYLEADETGGLEKLNRRFAI